MGWCRKCNGSATESYECYQIPTQAVLTRWKCLICGDIVFTHSIYIDDNGCEHPVFKTRKQWINDMRKYDYHFLALTIKE